MRNFKNYLIIFLLIIPFVFSGCSVGKGGNQRQGSGNQNESGERQNQNRAFMRIENKNLTEGSTDDLKIGAFAWVMGSESEDGSTIASQIIIGKTQEDFNVLRGPMGSFGMGASSTDQNGATSSPNFNREQFQNMSGEERIRMRENMMNNMSDPASSGQLADSAGREDRARFEERRADGGESGQGRSGGTPRQPRSSRLSGEIMDIGEHMLTLKLEDGGSKLVFFSDKTFINVIKKEAEQEEAEIL